MKKMDEQETLLKSFPLLTPSCNFTRYEGFMCVEGNQLQVCVHVPNYPSLISMSFECSLTTGAILAENKFLIEKWIQTDTLSSFLENVKNFLALQIKRKTELCDFKEDCIKAESFKLLMLDLKKIDFCNVISISSNLTKVHLKAVDSAHRTHVLDVNVGKTYPLEPMEIQAMLPNSALEIINKNTCLESIYRSFAQQISHLQHAWNILDVIDFHCYVVDPEHPTRKDMGRRIIIDKNVSIYLDMNVEVTTMPNITVLGPEEAVQNFNSNLARNVELWDVTSSILDNLKVVLEIASLPSKSMAGAEVSLVHQGECLICFTLWMDGQMPCVICEHSLCGSAFHTSCLFQWLQTVPGNYQSLNYVYGACPNCGMPISCSVPKFN